MIMLTFLIIYINKANRDMKNYSIYHQKIKELSTLNQKIENTFLKKYRYIDYDALQTINHKFQETLDFLNQQKFVYKFDQPLKEKIDDFYATYKQKQRFIEQFKATNSRLTNSIHYLYDLHQSIEAEANISSSEKRIFLDIFFQVEQLAMELPNDLALLQANINKIKAIKANNKLYKYFYQHSTLFIKDIDFLKNILEKNEQLNLANKLQTLSQELEQHSNTMHKMQYNISLIFFIFGFLNLIFLIINYKKIHKLVQDLFTFKYTIENSDNLIIITDKNRNIEYVNEAFEHKLGYSKEEIIGEQPSLIKSNLMNESTYRNLNETLERGEKWEGELINRKKDGSLIYEKASIVPIINKDKIEGFLSIKLDISEYVEQNHELKYLLALFDHTQEGVLILDQNGFIVTANSAFLNVCGYEMDHVYKKPLSSILSKNDQDILDNHAQTIQRDRVFSSQVEILTKSQIPLEKRVTIVAIYDHGHIINYLVIYRD